MPDYIDQDGNTVQAVPQAEADALVQSAEAAKKEAEDAKAQAAAASAELERVKANAGNVAQLRDKEAEAAKLKEEADKKANDALAAAQKAEETTVAMQKERVEEIKSAAVRQLVGTDKELEKKVLFHFDNSTTGPTGKKEEIETRVQNAWAIATANVQGGVLHGAAVSSSSGASGAPGVMEPETREFAKKFGLTDEDLKKFPPK